MVCSKRLRSSGLHPVDVVSSLARRTRAGGHLYTTRMALHAETSDLSVTAAELRTTLGELGLAPRRLAQLVAVNERTIRRWRDGTRRAPCGIVILARLLAAKAFRVEQMERGVDPIPTRANGSANSKPLAPVERAPEQSASARAGVGAFAGLSPAAAAVVALGPKSCRWPLGAPQDRDFR